MEKKIPLKYFQKSHAMWLTAYTALYVPLGINLHFRGQNHNIYPLSGYMPNFNQVAKDDAQLQ